MPKPSFARPKRPRDSEIWPKILRPDFEPTHFTWDEIQETVRQVKQQLDAEETQRRAERRR